LSRAQIDPFPVDELKKERKKERKKELWSEPRKKG
jgi:hypothetical protein